MLNNKLNITQTEGEEKRGYDHVIFKKWSVMKLLLLFKEAEQIGHALGDDFKLDGTMTAPQIGRLIARVGEQTIEKIASLISASIQKPADLKTEDILSWEIDDFVSAISTVIEMNFTDDLRKNFGRLRGVLSKVGGGSAEAKNGSKKTEEPTAARA